MSYNGGATQGSVDDIEKTGEWSAPSLGMLGAMDKIGMTISSTVWGVLLSKYEAKPFLVLGLGTNWLATLLFAVLTNHSAMLGMKLLMGFTEGLQWVWSQSWVMNKTDGTDYNLVFVSISSGTAAIGNLLGTVVAGFSTAYGLSYQFAFKVEAVGLVVCWLVLLWVAEPNLAIAKEALAKEDTAMPTMTHTASNSSTDSTRSGLQRLITPLWDEDVAVLPLRAQLVRLWSNKLFRYAALGFATLQYVAAALLFQWIRIFLGLWNVSKASATWSLILLPGAAGAIGMVGGAFFVIKEAADRRRTLRYLVYYQVLQVLFGSVGLLGLILQLLNKLKEPAEGAAVPVEGELTTSATVNLYLAWAGVFGGICCATVCQASLIGISTKEDVIGDPRIQTLAVGVQQCLTNFLGFAMGPLIPQVVMAGVATYLDCDANDPRITFTGGAAGIAGLALALLWVSLAFQAAREIGEGA